MRNALAVTALLFVAIAAPNIKADTIDYDTTGSTLSCNGVAGCVQDTTTSITDGGLTLTYNTGSGTGVVTPSIINLGNLDSTGTGTSVDLSGILLTINVNSTPPGSSGTLPNGAVSGLLSTNSSGTFITFRPSNTTSLFGTLPGVTISGSEASETYQLLNTVLGIQAPTVGNPVGETSIQGAVTSNPVATPEPSSAGLLLGGLGLLGWMAWKRESLGASQAA